MCFNQHAHPKIAIIKTCVKEKSNLQEKKTKKKNFLSKKWEIPNRVASSPTDRLRDIIATQIRNPGNRTDTSDGADLPEADLPAAETLNSDWTMPTDKFRLIPDKVFSNSLK